MGNISIAPFNHAFKHHHQTLGALSKTKRNMIGYFCTYAPLEFIHASGCLPVRIMGGSERVSRADAHMPSFSCPYLRKAFEAGLNGTYHYLTGIVQGYTCDVTCGLIHIWNETIGGELFHTVPLPYNDNTMSRQYFRSVLEELGQKLQAIGGKELESSLADSVSLYESIRKQISDLYDKRCENQLALSGRDMHAVIMAGFVLPPEEYQQMLKQLHQEIRNTPVMKRDGIPVIVSGSLVEDPLYFDLIEASGGRIAADDLCTGLRHIDQPDIEALDPVDRLIERHFKRHPCPARSRAVDRGRLLKELVKRAGAKGVIFLLQKFCTPHLADYPAIKDVLEKEGLQSILVEMDETGLNEGQLQTRLEGFFEVMGKR